MADSTWEIGKEELEKRVETQMDDAQNRLTAIERELAGLLVAQVLARTIGDPQDHKTQAITLAKLRAEQTGWKAELDHQRQRLGALVALQRPADFPD
jgi:hypothetical protein